MTICEFNNSNAMSFWNGFKPTISIHQASRQVRKVRMDIIYLQEVELTLRVDILKAITQAPETEQPSKEDLEAIINKVCLLFLTRTTLTF